jgi:hypothetical protein
VLGSRVTTAPASQEAGESAGGDDSELEEAQFECSGWKCGAVKGQAEEGEGGLVNRRTGIWSVTPSSFFPPPYYEGNFFLVMAFSVSPLLLPMLTVSSPDGQRNTLST